MNSQLYVGVGRTNITPPIGTLLMGYPDPDGQRKADRVRDPLHATALVFRSQERMVAVVSLDVGIIEDQHVEEIRQGAGAGTGIDPAVVTVCAIQTHSAPRTQHVWGWCDLDMEYINRVMVPGAIEAIAKAHASLVPARMGIGVTHSQVGINRRQLMDDHAVGLGQNPWGAYAPEMTVLRFESAKATLANLVHYGAHPTALGAWSRPISRDWPGIMIDRMESLTNAPTLFINGAVGDIAPRSNSLGATGDNETALLEVGFLAALDAMRAWRSIKDMRDVELATITGSFELPYRPLPSLERAKQHLAAADAEKNKPGAGMCEYMHWQAVVDAHARPLLAAKRYDQVITALGPVTLVPVPGEPFAETVLRLRHDSPFQHTLCASTSCGNNGYFCTRESLHRGGYEVWVGKALGAYLLADGIDDVLVEENLRLLDALHGQMYPPLTEEA